MAAWVLNKFNGQAYLPSNGGWINGFWLLDNNSIAPSVVKSNKSHFFL